MLRFNLAGWCLVYGGAGGTAAATTVKEWGKQVSLATRHTEGWQVSLSVGGKVADYGGERSSYEGVRYPDTETDNANNDQLRPQLFLCRTIRYLFLEKSK
mmetsp:Transcript_3239/g.5976  ORF Transcript_3239/g.5976 Transcript_3239/m.5976 type:complete len:100 (-) Transcript_3239:32-331(-)